MSFYNQGKWYFSELSKLSKIFMVENHEAKNFKSTVIPSPTDNHCRYFGPFQFIGMCICKYAHTYGNKT